MCAILKTLRVSSDIIFFQKLIQTVNITCGYTYLVSVLCSEMEGRLLCCPRDLGTEQSTACTVSQQSGEIRIKCAMKKIPNKA